MSRNDDHEPTTAASASTSGSGPPASSRRGRSPPRPITGGKVAVHGDRVKPASPLQVGDEIAIRLGPYEHVVRVRALSERRGPATVAATLYEETPDSLAARTKLAEQLRMAPAAFVYEEKGRPTKRDRRDIEKWRRSENRHRRDSKQRTRLKRQDPQ